MAILVGLTMVILAAGGFKFIAFLFFSKRCLSFNAASLNLAGFGAPHWLFSWAGISCEWFEGTTL